MEIINREFYNVSRRDTFSIVPIFDVHIGMGLCDEKKLAQTVKRIEDDPNCYWIGGGDYCEFINRSDPRFGLDNLASWIGTREMVDLAGAQRDRFLDYVKPIADKCLCLLMGNHEAVILKYYERNIYSDIIGVIKGQAGMSMEEKLGLGYYGWLILKFYRQDRKKKDKSGSSWIKINIHHGHVGGRLAGAKALAIQRHMWAHRADIVLFGHSHNTGTQIEATEYIDRRGNVRQHKCFGAYCGNFIGESIPGITPYSDVKGFLPLPQAGVDILLQPRAKRRESRIKLVTRL